MSFHKVWCHHDMVQNPGRNHRSLWNLWVIFVESPIGISSVMLYHAKPMTALTSMYNKSHIWLSQKVKYKFLVDMVRTDRSTFTLCFSNIKCIKVAQNSVKGDIYTRIMKLLCKAQREATRLSCWIKHTNCFYYGNLKIN